MLTEVTHLQEILQQLCLGAGDPYALPASSEQVIRDLKGTDGHTWSFQVKLSFTCTVIFALFVLILLVDGRSMVIITEQGLFQGWRVTGVLCNKTVIIT